MLTSEISPSPKFVFLQHTSICDQYGGVEYYLHDLVTLAAASEGASNVRSIINLRGAAKKSLPYPADFVPVSENRWLKKIENRFSLRLSNAAGRILKNPGSEFIIASHVSLGPLAHYLSKKYKVPYYVVVYGIDCWGNLWPQDEWTLRRANGIISISHWTKKILVERGYDPKQIEIVQPRLPESFANIPTIRRSENERVTLLTVSRLDAQEQYKGQDHVMRAIDSLRRSQPRMNLRYIIQGEGTDQPRLEALARELNLTSIVEFQKKVSDRTELENLYREADIFIMPSRFGFWDNAWRGEGFGIVYLEAAAFGLPSIAYDCGGATDIIRDHVNGILVEPDATEKLAQAIHRLVDQPEMRLALGSAAKQCAEKMFGESSIRGQWQQATESFRSRANLR